MVESTLKTESAPPIQDKSIKICIKDAQKAKPLLARLIGENSKWTSVAYQNQAQLSWYTCKEEDDVMIEQLKAGKIISRYPFTKGIYHKDTFKRAMQFPMQIFPAEFDFIPPTFESTNPKDWQRFNEYKKLHPNATYIAKP